MSNLNPQALFWKQQSPEDYTSRNAGYSFALEVDGWRRMLEKAGPIQSILECGSNVGRNIKVLNEIFPEARKSIIELNDTAYTKVTADFALDRSFHGPIIDADFGGQSFDLVFSQGVLIMIHPDELLENMQQMYSFSNQYILIGEYFNKTPVMIPYHGQDNLLFKCDFGRVFQEHFDVALVDYGFLWSLPYQDAFDDITWWLFQKKQGTGEAATNIIDES